MMSMVVETIWMGKEALNWGVGGEEVAKWPLHLGH